MIPLLNPEIPRRPKVHDGRVVSGGLNIIWNTGEAAIHFDQCALYESSLTSHRGAIAYKVWCQDFYQSL